MNPHWIWTFSPMSFCKPSDCVVIRRVVTTCIKQRKRSKSNFPNVPKCASVKSGVWVGG
uniref:Uncharacterized protein n=1 Tax=Anguilla anguilla TaxID=7936 RepID=A0A0E9TCZ0_ANGAN